jgi:hypothetical protein
MTLTPPRSGCETDQSAVARLLAKKSGPRIKRCRWKRHQVARRPLAGPWLSWRVAGGGQAPRQPRACFAPMRVSRFVSPSVPPPGADAQEFSQGVRTVRRAVRRHQPDRGTKSRRSCAGGSSVHRRVRRRGWSVLCKDFLLVVDPVGSRRVSQAFPLVVPSPVAGEVRLLLSFSAGRAHRD